MGWGWELTKYLVCSENENTRCTAGVLSVACRFNGQLARMSIIPSGNPVYLPAFRKSGLAQGMSRGIV